MQDKTALGKRLQCIECGIKFYDLNRKEAICPKCGGAPVDPRLVKPSIPKMVYLKTEPEDVDNSSDDDMEMISIDDMEDSYSDLDLDELE